MKKYKVEERYIAFMDILGFSKIIENDDNPKRIFEAIEDAIKEQKELKKEYLDSDLKITWFSDSIVISKSGQDIYNLQFLLSVIISIQRKLLLQGILLRGGVAKGECYHSEKNVYGKSMIEAYKLESKKAITPRIIISEDIIKEIDKSIEEENKEIEENYNYQMRHADRDYAPIISKSYIESIPVGEEIKNNIIKKDTDNTYFINYLQESLSVCVCKNNGEIYKKEMYEDFYKEILCKVRDIISCGLKSGEMHVTLKYIWLKDYYNNTIRYLCNNMNGEYKRDFYTIFSKPIQ